jgi:hypothetical protein
MDIGPLNSLNNQTTAVQTTAKIEAPVNKKSEAESAPLKIPQVEQADLRVAEEKRMQAMRDAAKRSLSNAYVVSDQSFTIYKDMTGRYITRFTNLKDGTVTYFPEPDLIKQISLQGGNTSFLQVRA